MSLEYWFMFPVSILIATVAMATGVEGATFFTPLFILGLGLPPDVAIATGLLTEVFASGLFAYTRRRLIDYRLGGTLLLATIPMALLGTWVAGWANPLLLKAILGVALLVLAATFLRGFSHERVEALEAGAVPGDPKAETQLVTASGEVIRYTVCNRTEGLAIAGLGGLFIGMISTGQGEFNGYYLLSRCKIPGKVAVATSVLVVAVTALTASISHAARLAAEGGPGLSTALSLAVFTVPGVLIGGQLGPLVSSCLPQGVLVRGMGGLFALVGVLMLGQAFLARG